MPWVLIPVEGMKNTGLAVVKLMPRLEAEVLYTETVVDLSTPRTYHAVADVFNLFAIDCMCLLVFETSLRSRDGKPVLLKASSLTQRTIGAMEILASLSATPIYHYDETEVKRGIAGKPNASKTVVHGAVGLMLGWKQKPKGVDGHALDAVAVCLYHQSIDGLGKRIGGAS